MLLAVHYSKERGQVIPGGVPEAAERLMVRLHEEQADRSGGLHAFAMGGAGGKGEEGGNAVMARNRGKTRQESGGREGSKSPGRPVPIGGAPSIPITLLWYCELLRLLRI